MLLHAAPKCELPIPLTFQQRPRRPRSQAPQPPATPWPPQPTSLAVYIGRRSARVPISRDLTTCPPAHSPTGVRSLPRRGPDATTHRQFHWGSRDARRSRSLQQRLPQTVYTSIGICRQRYKPPPVSVWQRAANSRLDKFRHSLPLLDGRNFRPPVHLNIKR